MTNDLKQTLVRLTRKLSYREGKFVLTSGKESTFYVDMKNVTLHPEGMKALGALTWQLLDPKRFVGVGGPTLGADPLATGLSLAALDKGVILPAYIIRKEPKKHGTSQWIEGRENLSTGGELLLVEDVVTTGGSSIKAIERIRSEGFKVNTVLALMDREEGAEAALRAIGCELVRLITISDVRQERL